MCGSRGGASGAGASVKAMRGALPGSTTKPFASGRWIDSTGENKLRCGPVMPS